MFGLSRFLHLSLQGANPDTPVFNDPVTAVVGAQVFGSLLGANAAGEAADAQLEAGRNANALQWNMYQQNRADLEPWRQMGQGGLNNLGFRMGIGDIRDYVNRNALRDRFTTGEGENAVFDRAGYQDAVRDRVAGLRESGNFGSLMRPFNANSFKKEPGYKFRLDEGMKALERSAAARGLLGSGRTAKELERFGQNFASNEYTNAYNRYNMDRSNEFNRLAGIAGIGQSATGQLVNQGAGVANAMGNNMLHMGNAAASGYMGAANAWGSGINQGINFYNQQRMFDILNRGGISGGGGNPYAYYGGQNLGQDDYSGGYY